MHLEQCLCSKQCKCWVSFNYSVSLEEDKPLCIFKAEGTSCRGDGEAEKPDRRQWSNLEIRQQEVFDPLAGGREGNGGASGAQSLIEPGPTAGAVAPA